MAAESGDQDLTLLPLEDLLKVKVTSAAKRPQTLGQASSAIFVLTAEDIRRSGATVLPEALRIVPGLQVARITANSWAISARGFNGRFANKLLVLIDGRSVYTPLFSGVFWDREDVPLEDIERIEVIRGPGASLWGANAVDGVINVITRSASETQGGLATAGAGSSTAGRTYLRYGGRVGAASVRVYASLFRDFQNRAAGNIAAGDEWTHGTVGFRADGGTAASGAWTAEGAYYAERGGETYLAPILTPPFAQLVAERPRANGGHLLGRWNRAFSATSDLTLQVYYDHSGLDDLRLTESLDTADIDLLHRWSAGRHEVVWGGGYRITRDHAGNRPTIALIPADGTFQLINAFAQDTVPLVEDRLFVTIGSKFEHNSYTGSNAQPNIRLLWTPTESESLWAAISRAVRTPSRAEEGLRLTDAVAGPGQFGNITPFPDVIVIQAARGVQAETLVAYELGARIQVTPHLSVDASLFYNSYHDLITATVGATSFSLFPSPHLVTLLVPRNIGDATSYGGEVTATWQAAEWWRLQPSFSTMLMAFATPAGGGPAQGTAGAAGQNPRHQFGLRSLMDLSATVTLDGFLRAVDRLPALGVPAYADLNLRLAWQPTPALELSLAGENLLGGAHPEFGSETLPTIPSRIPRAIYGRAALRF